MILEVNNTFDERRMYLLTLGRGGRRRIGYPAGVQADEADQVKTLPAMFRHSWPKDFHVSPFNSRKGSYALTASDPLSPSMQGTGPISNTVYLLSSKGHGKLVARLFSDGPAIVPSAMTAYEKLRFLASWGWVGHLTFPRILREAFTLFFRRKLHVWYRPEPLNESIGRRATPTEQQLEPIFRRYLQHLVEQSATPLIVKYVPSGLSQTAAHRMRSPAAQGEGCTAEELEFKVLTPVFYTRFVYYAHDIEAFFCELNESCTIWVSRPDLLPKLALKKKPLPVLESSVLTEYIYFRIIQSLRVRPERIVRPLTSSTKLAKDPQTRVVDIRDCRISSMDAYVLTHESLRIQAAYRSCVLKLFLADRISFGSVPLLAAQRLTLQGCLAWLFSVSVGQMLKGFPFAAEYHDPQSA